MKRQVICLMLLMVMCFTLTGCFDYAGKILSGKTLNGEYGSVDQTIKKKDSMVHKMGEQLEAKDLNRNTNTPEIMFKYTLNKAKVYTNPKAAGLKEKQLIPVDSYPAFSDDSKWLTVKDEMKMQVILCDLTITNIADNDPWIIYYKIVYEGTDGNLHEIGNPIYFSHHTGGVDDAQYYRLALAPGKTVNCQVAWACNIKDFKNHPLYFCYQSIDEYWQLIPIDMDVQYSK